MKHTILKVIAATIIVSSSYSEVKSQVSTLGNFSGNPAHFVGWNSSVLTFPLQIRHDANQSIQFGTNGNERMRILRYGNIGIGTGASEVGPKLMSFLDNDNASFLESTNFESTAIFGHNNYSTADTEAFSHIGVRGLCDGVNPEEDKRNTAGEFTARYAFQDVGVEAYVGADPMNSELVGRLGWGVRTIATDHSMANIGVSGRATPFPNSLGTFTVGVAGGVDGAGTNMWAGFFEGSGLFVDGTFYPSDESFK